MRNMLILKRITHFNEFLKCKASGQILMYGDFYYTISDLANDIALSERNCRAAIQKLINEKILIKKDFKGIPAKQYYTIDEAELSKVIEGR